MTPSTDDEFRHADKEADVVACFALMHQLRPHLADAAELVERWRLQQQSGYRILAFWRDGDPRALSGYRVVDNLIHGRHLYIDDLVTDESDRSNGLGSRMLDRMKQETKALGCHRLVLDTAIDNLLGHRFYFRNGLLARGLRFSVPVP